MQQKNGGKGGEGRSAEKNRNWTDLAFLTTHSTAGDGRVSLATFSMGEMKTTPS
jgi:hypothetical protein